MSQVLHSHSHMMGCHSVTSHEECGKIAHIPCSSCISSIQEMNENSIEFSLSTQTWSGFKLSWLKSYTVQIAMSLVSIDVTFMDWTLELFDNRVVRPDVSNCYSDMEFFNTTICDDSSTVGVYLRHPKDVIKVLEMLV